MQKNKCALCLPVSQRSMDLNPPLLFTTRLVWLFFGKDAALCILGRVPAGRYPQACTERPAQDELKESQQKQCPAGSTCTAG